MCVTLQVQIGKDTDDGEVDLAVVDKACFCDI